MVSRIFKVLFLFILINVAIPVKSAGTESLLARWSFTPGKTLYADDQGKYRLQSWNGKNGKIQRNSDGSILLDNRAMLFCPEINSRNHPSLRREVTLYARIKILSKPGTGFLFGLLDGETPLDWKQLTCGSVLNRSSLRSLIMGLEGENSAPGSQPFREGEFNDIAISYNAAERTLLFCVNGRCSLRSKVQLSGLNPFQSFAVGRLKASGGAGMAVSEIRIYTKALSMDAISNIEANSPQSVSLRNRELQKLVIEDFSDIGTWRSSAVSGAAPGASFSFDYFLGGRMDPERNDGGSGKLQFHFSGKERGELLFSRFKSSMPEVYATGIEFEANSRSIDGGFRFQLTGSCGKTILTPWVRMEKEKGWKHYQLKLDSQNCPGFEALKQPVRLTQIRFMAEKVSGVNHVLLDDLTLTGRVSKGRWISLKPATESLAILPHQTSEIHYQLRNARPMEIKGILRVKLTDYEQRTAGEFQKNVAIARYGFQSVAIKLPPLPPGAYQADVEFSSAEGNAFYMDWLGVFLPNRHRINENPMYFGVCDNFIWQGEGENKLHLEWMRLGGFDINRVTITGDRLDQGDVDRFSTFSHHLRDLERNGMLACISYTNGLPAYTRPNLPPDGRRPPTDRLALKAHIEKIFRFLNNWRNAQYFEVWNEPQIEFWKGSFEEYVTLLNDFYQFGKPLAPHMKILCAALDNDSHPRGKKDFSRKLISHLKGRCDMASFHHHGNVEQYTQVNRLLLQRLKAANIAFRLGNCEAGFRAGYTPDSIRQQAEMVVKKLIAAKALGNEFFLYFMLQDYWDMDRNADDSFGLVTSDNRPKPSFVAYNELIRQLANTRVEKSIPHPELVLHVFRNQKEEVDVWVLWPKQKGNQVQLAVQGESLKAVDFLGRPADLQMFAQQGVVTIPGFPIYLQGKAGSLKILPSVISQEKISVYRPNHVADILLKLYNPFDCNATLFVHMPGFKPESVSLKPGEEKKAVFQARIQKNIVNGILSDTGKAVFVTEKGEHKTLNFPLTLCVPLSFGKHPVSVAINRLEQVVELTYDPNIPGWKGANDLSCILKGTREGDYIKLTFTVTDDKHFPAENAKNGWMGDGIQLGIYSMKGAFTEVTLSEHGVWRHIAPVPETVGKWDIPFRFQRKKTKSIYEISLPIRELGVEKGFFRFAFLVNENDGLGRIRWMEWASGIGRAKNPDQFGWAFLE